MVKLYLASCSMFDVRKRVIMLTAVYVLLGLMIVMITDNVIVYSYVMFIFAVFIGAGAGVVGMSTSERMLYNCMMVNKGVMCK